MAMSEPAVAGWCGAPGATNLRYTVSISGLQEETAAGRPIQLKVRTNFYPYALRPAVNSGSSTYPDNGIAGVIDSVPWDGSQVFVNGWACARGLAQSIGVHVYVGGPAGTGPWLTAGTANLWSEPAVLQACGVGSGAYRYSIPAPFGPAEMMQFGGKTVYVHGISPLGGSNRLLGNSGAFALPGSVASVKGGCGY